MKKFMMMAFVLPAIGLQADTVAWWHLNEGANGERPVGGMPAILNAVDSTSLPLTAAVQNEQKALVFDQDEYLPVYTNAFPEYATWQCGRQSGLDCRGFYFRTTTDTAASAKGGVLYADATPALKVQTLTVELFFKADFTEVGTLWKNLIMLAGSGATEGWSLRVNASGTLFFRHHHSGGTAKSVTMDKVDGNSINALDGKWHHVAMTFDGSTLNLYYDYQLGKTVENLHAFEYAADCRLQIGASNQAAYGLWHGWIDEVRISNTVLPVSDFIHPRTGLPRPTICDADTVFYHSFDTLETVDDPFFGTVDTPGFGNESSASGAYPSSLVVSSNAPAAVINDLPFDLFHSGLAATTTLTNGGFWRFVSPDHQHSSGILLSDRSDGRHDFCTGSFTCEMFLRGTLAGRTEITYLLGTLNTSNTGQVLFEWLANGRLQLEMLPDGETTRKKVTTTTAINDGTWRHVAFVYDRDAEKAFIYINRALAATMEDIDLETSASTTNPYLWLFSTWSRELEGDVDEIRLTKRALKPMEFLRAGEAGRLPLGDTQASIAFDGTYQVDPRPLDLPTGVVESAGVAFSDDIPGAFFVDAAGNVLIETNRQSVAFTGGRLFFGQNPLLDGNDMRDQTLEFFFCAAPGSAVAWANILRLSANATYVDDCVYSVSYADADGAVYLRCDTAASGSPGYNQGVSFTGSNLDDGRWHHIAFTFERCDDGANTRVTFYKDHNPFGVRKMNGLLRTVESGAIPATSFFVGSSQLRATIDQIRITRGILPPADMMHVYRPMKGFRLILK